MTLSLHDASVPVFTQMLGGLDDVLAKTQVLLLAADFSHDDPGDSSRQLLDDLSRAFDRDRQ